MSKLQGRVGMWVSITIEGVEYEGLITEKHDNYFTFKSTKKCEYFDNGIYFYLRFDTYEFTEYNLKEIDPVFKEKVYQKETVIVNEDDVATEVPKFEPIPKVKRSLSEVFTMNPQTNISGDSSFRLDIESILYPMVDLLEAKNSNYGDSFTKSVDKYGTIIYGIRLDDKYNRFEQIMLGEQDKVGESLEDTLLDMIGYCTLILRDIKNRKGR